MIIKKKYAAIKKAIDEAPEADTLSIINDAVQSYENEFLDEKTPQEETASEIFSESEDEDALETEHRRQELDDLDLTLENINFEQREERREGTRRRGYRRSQDRNLVTRAQQEALAIRDAAKREGYNEGLKNAQEDIEDIKSKMQDFFDCTQAVFDKVSLCIMDIAFETAKKIIGKEIEENKEYIIPLIKSLIENINKTEPRITLKVMPKDAAILRDKINDIFDTKYFEAKILVQPDSSIKDGGVIIETSNGIIDASIETRLALMEQAFKKAEKTDGEAE